MRAGVAQQHFELADELEIAAECGAYPVEQSPAAATRVRRRSVRVIRVPRIPRPRRRRVEPSR